MDTPPLYLLYNTNYPPNQPNPGDGQPLSTMVICFIALGAFIAFLLIIGLIILIYNLCRYGACCPPSAYPGCCNCCCSSPGCCPCYCATCCDQPPGGVEIVKPYPSVRSVRSASIGRGSYVGRGTRFNQATYVVDAGTIRSDTLGRRRNSVILVDSGTLPRRRQSIGAPARPQIIVANSLPESSRGMSTVARRSLRALPGPSAAVAQGSMGCNTRCAPVSTGNLYGGGDDDGDIRVIVRNQPYTSRSSIIELPPTAIGSSYNNSGFDNFNAYQSGRGGGECGGGCGGGVGSYGIGGGGGGGGGGSYDIGGGGGGLSNVGYDCGCGGQQQSGATVDVHFGQVPEYTSDIGVVQQGSIYPTLSQPAYY